MTREEAIKGLKVFAKDFSGYRPNEEMFDMAIEALKTDVPDTNVGDTISRQAAIDAIKHHGEIENDYTDIYHDGYCDGIFDSVDTLEQLPSAQPEIMRWIPVSERLPEINKPVLVWLYDEYYLSELHSIDGALYWDFDQFDLSGDEFNDVIAWMPLPKPYKEG